MRLLLLAVIATPAIAFWPTGPQDPEQIDWTKHVSKACESRRYGIRLSAAKRVANGGDAAIHAITAYIETHGLNSISPSLVDMIADAKVHQPKIIALLTTWANNQSFYWRASAMRGLALRASAASGEQQTWAELFDRFTNDPAWLMRTNARLGAKLIGLSDSNQQPELDPRARVRLASMLLDNGHVPPLQPLIDGLADKRMFLGIPWGARIGQESKKALSNWLAADFPKLTGGNPTKSIAAIITAAQKKSGQSLTTPKQLVDIDHGIIGGFEIASCKFGDQFVQWSADGTFRFGIDGSRTAKLPANKWQELLQQQSAIALDTNAGVVVCDKLQMVVIDPKTRVDVAPMSMPEPASNWLKRLVLEFENANETEIAADLRRGLGQFEGQ